MQVNVQEFLKESGITEAFYPGKRIVQQCRQPGEFKSHCIVLDWRDPHKIRVEVKAGLSGRDLEPAKLKYYPVCFQTPTYVEIEMVNTARKEEEESEGKSTSGKSSSSGGKQPARKPLDSFKTLATEAFGSVTGGKIPEWGKIAIMVVMGTQIAAEAFANVMGKLAHQISHAKVSGTDLLAQAGKFVTKYTPPAFMKPTGDEDKVYKYDREKNADIGYRPGLG